MDEDPRQFISRLQKRVLEAENAKDSTAALADILTADLELYLNGKELGWPWFREHMLQLQRRLRDVTVTVTHAARTGDVLVERHVIDAIEIERGTPWRMEVMAAYELTPDNRVRRQYELTHMLEGTYEGGW